MLTQGAGGPLGPLGLTIPSDFHPRPVESARDLVEVTYCPPPADRELSPQVGGLFHAEVDLYARVEAGTRLG